jgi:hypothetical protein
VYNSGKVDSQIVIRNFPGETPVIDGNYANTIFTLGTYVAESYITFDSLTIIHANIAGIMLGTNYMATHIIITNCVIVGTAGASAGIGCIYFSNTWSDITVENCFLEPGTPGCICAAGTPCGDGIHIFSAGSDNNATVVNNEIFNCVRGIYIKRGVDYPPHSFLIKNNYIHDTQYPGIDIDGDRSEEV